MTATLTLPQWCAPGPLHPAGDRDDWTVLACKFTRPLDEDGVDYALAMLGYFWRKHMVGCTIVDEAGAATIHDDWTVVAVPAASAGRTNRTRRPAQAIAALHRDLVDHWVTGSPLRRDGTRLVEPPAGIGRVGIIGLFTG